MKLSSASCATTSGPMPLPRVAEVREALESGDAPPLRRGGPSARRAAVGILHGGQGRGGGPGDVTASGRVNRAPLVDRLEAMVHELGRRVNELSIDRLRELTERAEGR